MGDTRRRSFWGWGWADRFPDRETRRGLAAQVSAFLGGAELEARDPPRLEDLALPRPRVAAPPALAAFADAGPEARARHTYGRAFRDVLRGFEGAFGPAPDLVLSPRTEAEVAAALEWAEAAGVALVPYGGGTSVVGGVEADVGPGFAGAVSLDLRGLGRVLEVEPRSRTARIQAGATGPVLEAGLAPHGLTLRHYPQSFEHSTLGGWIVTRAAGHHATRRTHIEDRVAAVRMLTPRGVLETRRLPAGGAGPDPVRFVAGSEGTLGVVTEAWVRLEARPVHRAKADVRFGRFEDAVAAVRALSQSGLDPAGLRLLDAREAMLNGVGSGEAAVLLLGFESADHALGPWIDRAVELARDHGGELAEGAVRITEGRPERGADEGSWRQAFLEAPYLMNVLVSLGVVVDTFETACPWDRFEALHRQVIHDVRQAMKEVAGGGIVTCRFTHVYPDGPAPYYTFLAPGRRGAELTQWAEIKAAASEAILAAGGTITHHHGVGRVHREAYRRERPAPFGEVLRAAKATLDPAGILNPGVLL